MAESKLDRRVSPRVAGNFRVRVGCYEGEFTAPGCDLGAESVSCTLPGGIKVSAPVELNISLPLPEAGEVSEIRCRGELVRKEAPGGGQDQAKVVFRLDEMAPEDRLEIESYIAGRADHPASPDRVNLVGMKLEPNGFWALSDTYLPLYHEIRINFTFSGEEKVECSGIVVKCERKSASVPFEVVFFFTDMAASARERIGKYLSARARA